MKRLAPLGVLLIALAALWAPGIAQADFGISAPQIEFREADGSPARQAGSHPYALDIFFEVNRHEEGGQPFVDGGDIKDLIFEQARGFVGDTTAVARCSTIDFATIVNHEPSCPDQSAVGVSAATITDPNPANALPAAVYNLDPPPGVPVRLGFVVQETPVVIDIAIKPSPDYNAVGGPVDIPQPLTVFSSAFELWGEPSDPAHDFARGHCFSYALPSAAGVIVEGRLNFQHEGPQCAEAGQRKPFLTLPRTCTPLQTVYRLDPWSEPGAFRSGSVPTGPFEGCGRLGFDPHIASRASTDSAESGSGLDFEIDFRDPVDHSGEGLTEPGGIASSDIKKTVVALPEGMTVDPSLAEGLGVCTPADLARETLAADPGGGCPNASKIGTVSVDTPLVEEPIEGSVFLAQQDDPTTPTPGAENPFDSLIAFYIVIEDKPLGILVKVPAKVEPDPRTGQLLTTVDDIPQLPFSVFRFHFDEGQRPTLITPPACGQYETAVQFTPWARPEETITRTASFQIAHGVGGGPCPPGGAPPFNPGFEAGSQNNAAATYSPFLMRLTRQDGEQDITRFSSVLPPGLAGKIAGVGRCSEAEIAHAIAARGRAELASPSCPADSEIGHTLAGAGVGSALTYVPGFLYLAGPYHGDPLSVLAVTPAVAGPFDVGDVVVRIALTLDPRSGEVHVDGSASDPIPHILAGIPLKVREIRVAVDRPQFTLNPTSCAPSAVRATLFGSGLDLFSAADDGPVELSSRYQAADCARLGFKPRLALKLKGGTKRGRFPALRAVYSPRPGEANLSRLALAFPRSEFIEQGHFRTICTRVQFAAGPGFGARCPKGSVYGHVKAWTPLLSEPLSGPVFLRSSDHNLPDAVFALHGPPSAEVQLEVPLRIDSVHGRLRATLSGAPDDPVSRAVVHMQGGQKGLFVNSTGLCAKRHRARANLLGQNGRRELAHPVVRALGCKAAHRKRHRGHGRR